MTRYIAGRVLQAVPLLVLVSMVVFLLMRLIPGGPLAVYANDPSVSAEDLERLRGELGLDVPIHEQYLSWLGAVVRGDWGVSQVTHRKAFDEIAERLPNTLILSGSAFVLALALSIPIGVVSATPGHCVPLICLHWGALAGQVYRDPLSLLGFGRPILLPLG